MSDTLKTAMEQLANKNKRSLSEQIEFILEDYRAAPELRAEDLFWAGNFLANIIAFTQKKTGKHWLTDAETHQESVFGVITAMANLRLTYLGEPLVSGDSLGKTLGKVSVQHLVEEMPDHAKRMMPAEKENEQ
jgi:hypothetical protein